jgi:hypothetical protein
MWKGEGGVTNPLRKLRLLQIHPGQEVLRGLLGRGRLRSLGFVRLQRWGRAREAVCDCDCMGMSAAT